MTIDFTEYSIESGNDNHVFAVDSLTGSLYVVGELNYNRQKVTANFISFHLCFESGHQSRSVYIPTCSYKNFQY